MNNAFLVVPGWNAPVRNEHVTTPVRVPDGCTDVRFSLVSTDEMRKLPQFGQIMQVWWTDANGKTPIKRDLFQNFGKPSWSQDELAEGLPTSGHAVGSAPGVVPHDAGPFAYEVEGSPAVNASDRPEGYTHAFLRYTVLGGNNGSPVYVSVVLEAFTNDEASGSSIPLEFT